MLKWKLEFLKIFDLLQGKEYSDTQSNFTFYYCNTLIDVYLILIQVDQMEQKIVTVHQSSDLCEKPGLNCYIQNMR